LFTDSDKGEAMEKQHTFFVCIYKSDDGKQIGHAVSQHNDFSENISAEKKSGLRETSQEGSGFADIFAKFKHSMFAYIDLLPLIASAAPFATWMLRSQNLIKMLNDECVHKCEEKNRIVYELPERLYQNYKELEETADSLSLIGRQVPKMLIIGIVSSYEYYSSLLIREIYRSNAGMIEGSEKNISIKDVFLSGNLEDFKEIVIDKEIEDVMRRAFPDQIRWFENALSLKTPIREEYPKWDELVEIFERRNIFAHANGIVGKRYLDKLNNLKLPSDKTPERGQELYANGRYFKQSLENITEFGLKLIQVVWRKLYREEVDIADNSASDFAFDLIRKGEYKLASTIYRFLEANKNIDAELRLRNIVNLANCYALLNDEPTRDQVLATHEWAAVSDNYAIAVAAVKGDTAKVIALMKKLKHDEEWYETFYEEWPVFFHVREDADFIEAFEYLYGRTFVPEPRTKNASKALQLYLGEKPKDLKEEDGPALAGASLH
tara:strand:- start:421 stop:1899 length:1479 start_codon:yes stop_codon:yes gene_type:complete